jgi:anti-sigma B factor antagonist
MTIARYFHNPTTVVFIVNGMILLGDGDATLRDNVEEVLTGHGRVELFVLDLHGVPDIDSTGLNAIVSCLILVQWRGKKLVLCDLTKKIADLLAVTKLTTVFDVYDTVEEATAAHQKP